MNDNFWYPRDPQRYLTDTQWCDAATEVAHVRLIDTYYALGRPIKDEQSRIQNIGKIKDADFARVRGNLFELGWRIEDGVWRHKRIEETMAEMDSERSAKIKGSALGVQRRRELGQLPPAKPQVEPVVEPMVEPNPHPSVNTTTTTTTTIDTATATAIKGKRTVASLPRFQKPSIEEIKLQTAKVGLSDAEADKFFNYYESNGWRVGRNPMKSWPHALTNWKNNSQNYGNKNTPKPNPRNLGTGIDTAEVGRQAAALVKRRTEEREASALQPMAAEMVKP
jgi:uncharacterized protein YdaU (DUF1376 family)